MKFFSKGKDGGPYSTVTGYWLVEIKGLFSIALLRFDKGSREAFHNHAFHSISWLLKGEVEEYHLTRAEDGQVSFGEVKNFRPSLKPILTYRSTFHKVISKATSWVLTFRGP